MRTKDSFDYSLHCPDVLHGGKPNCSDQDCECAKDGETACIFGVCVCFHQMHLVFNSMSCRDENHSQMLKNASHNELSCPKTCSAYSPNNQCPHPSFKGKDGRCYCTDESLVVPKFTIDHKLEPYHVCPDATFVENVNSTIFHRNDPANQVSATKYGYSVSA